MKGGVKVDVRVKVEVRLRARVRVKGSSERGVACCARMAAARRVCSVASSCVQLSCISLSAASFCAQTSERRALTIMKF